ncbi:10281_t:CDS:2 [Diversispora eburnea]|uniref:10281_t:CDS:1 n=1 Tax=Diversispora eburnea TaxID=1213867 RepID=A0A9N9A446_9GLOM|nr:10281_t:CDS:2 [Diversispora eburnea]
MSTFGTSGAVIPFLQSVGATGFSTLSYITTTLTGAVGGYVIEDLRNKNYYYQHERQVESKYLVEDVLGYPDLSHYDKFSFSNIVSYGNQFIASVQEKIPSKDEIISSSNNIISYVKEKITFKDEIISSSNNIISYAKEKILSKDEIISSSHEKFSSAMQKISPAVQQVKEFAQEHPKIICVGGAAVVGGVVGSAAVTGVAEAIGSMGFGAGSVAAESLAATSMSTFGTSGVVIPFLQSVGAAGFSTLSYVTSSLAGALVGCVIEDLRNTKKRGRRNKSKDLI